MNAGEFRKSAGAGTSTISVPYSNTGTTTIGSGTVNFSGTVAQYSGTSLTAGTWVVNSATLGFPAGSNLTTIASAASVTLSGSAATFAKLAGLTTNQGSLTIAGGKSFTAGGALANTGTVVLTTGTLVSSTLTNHSGGVVRGSGAISGNLANSGIVGPGASPGVLTVSGNYTQTSSGVLNIEIQGTNAATSDFDQLLISGSTTLAGTLNVTLLNSFLPQGIDSFAFMTYASLSGDFGTINLPPTVAGRQTLSPTPGTTTYTLLGTTLFVLNTNDSGAGSLRQAILNANSHAGAEYVAFNITSGGVKTISPTSVLPDLTGPTTIDGTTQSGYSTTPVIELDGTNAGSSANGLTITGPNVTVRALAINRFSNFDIRITGSNATGALIVQSHLGVNRREPPCPATGPPASSWKTELRTTPSADSASAM